MNMSTDTTGALYPEIFHAQTQLMKDMLERGEMIYGGGDNPGYKRFKQETMRTHYNAIDAFWTLLQEHGMVEKCTHPGCNGMGRRWSDCPLCGGSGFMAKGTVITNPIEKEDPDGIAEDSG